MATERRKGFLKNSIMMAIISTVMVSCVMIPVQIVISKVNNSLSSPEEIIKMKKDIELNDALEAAKIEKICDDVKEIKISYEAYKENNEKSIMRLEKAITRLETLVDTFSRKISYQNN